MARNLVTLFALSVAFTSHSAPAGLPLQDRVNVLLASASGPEVGLETLRSRDRKILEGIAMALAEKYPAVVAGSEMVFSRLDDDGTVFYRLDFSGLGSKSHARALCEILGVDPCLAKLGDDRLVAVGADLGTDETSLSVSAAFEKDAPFVFESPEPHPARNPAAQRIEARARQIADPLQVFPEQRPSAPAASGDDTPLLPGPEAPLPDLGTGAAPAAESGAAVTGADLPLPAVETPGIDGARPAVEGAMTGQGDAAQSDEPIPGPIFDEPMPDTGEVPYPEFGDRAGLPDISAPTDRGGVPTAPHPEEKDLPTTPARALEGRAGPGPAEPKRRPDASSHDLADVVPGAVPHLPQGGIPRDRIMDGSPARAPAPDVQEEGPVPAGRRDENQPQTGWDEMIYPSHALEPEAANDRSGTGAASGFRRRHLGAVLPRMGKGFVEVADMGPVLAVRPRPELVGASGEDARLRLPGIGEIDVGKFKIAHGGLTAGFPAGASAQPAAMRAQRSVDPVRPPAPDDVPAVGEADASVEPATADAVAVAPAAAGAVSVPGHGPSSRAAALASLGPAAANDVSRDVLVSLPVARSMALAAPASLPGRAEKDDAARPGATNLASADPRTGAEEAPLGDVVGLVGMAFADLPPDLLLRFPADRPERIAEVPREGAGEGAARNIALSSAADDDLKAPVMSADAVEDVGGEVDMVAADPLVPGDGRIGKGPDRDRDLPAALPLPRDIALAAIAEPSAMQDLAGLSAPEAGAPVSASLSGITHPAMSQGRMPMELAATSGMDEVPVRPDRPRIASAATAPVADAGDGDGESGSVLMARSRPVEARGIGRVVFDERYARPIMIDLEFGPRPGRLQKLPISRSRLLAETAMLPRQLGADGVTLASNLSERGYVEVAQVPPGLLSGPAETGPEAEAGTGTRETAPAPGSAPGPDAEADVFDVMDRLLQKRSTATSSAEVDAGEGEDTPFAFQTAPANQVEDEIPVFPPLATPPAPSAAAGGLSSETAMTEREGMPVSDPSGPAAIRPAPDAAAGPPARSGLPPLPTPAAAPSPAAAPADPGRTGSGKETVLDVLREINANRATEAGMPGEDARAGAAPAAPVASGTFAQAPSPRPLLDQGQARRSPADLSRQVRPARVMTADDMMADMNSAQRAARDLAMAESARSDFATPRLQARTRLQEMRSRYEPREITPADLRIELSYVGTRDEVAARVAELRRFFPPVMLQKGRFFGATLPGQTGRYVVGFAADDIRARDDMIWYAEQVGIPYSLRR